MEKKRGGRRREEEEGCSGRISGSSVKLQPLCCKNTAAPPSLGTTASQILVWNDVRNVPCCQATVSTQLWRPSHTGNASSGTETWHWLPPALVNSQSKKKENTAFARVWVPEGGSSFCCCSVPVWGWGENQVFKWEILKLRATAGGWLGSQWVPETRVRLGQLMRFLALRTDFPLCSAAPSLTVVLSLLFAFKIWI